jgi:hypothetical protein
LKKPRRPAALKQGVGPAGGIRNGKFGTAQSGDAAILQTFPKLA